MKKILLVISILNLVGCATMSSSKDATAVKKVKTAAVVAFIDKKDASNRLAFSGNTGGMGATAGGTSFYEKSKETDAIYKTFAASISKPTGWKMKEMYDVANNPVYKEQAKRMMPIIHTLKPPPSGQNWYLANDLITPEALDMMGVDERNKMCAALGVDAIVAAEVETSAKSNWYFMGMGPRKPQGEVRFKVFQRGQAEPIWNEWIEGKKSEQSAGITGFTDEQAVQKLGDESLKTAFQRIGSDPDAKTE